MMQANLVKPREAAQVLGISYPTIKQWIYKRKLRTVKTAGGHHRVPQSEIDRFLHRIPNRLDVAERRRNFRRISGRNQLVGRVLDIKTSGLLAQVTLSIGEQRITAIVTADAIREMRLQEGIGGHDGRSGEHTAELPSRPHLVCRLLLVKKKQKRVNTY